MNSNGPLTLLVAGVCACLLAGLLGWILAGWLSWIAWFAGS